jgi:hypothetical protein
MPSDSPDGKIEPPHSPPQNSIQGTKGASAEHSHITEHETRDGTDSVSNAAIIGLTRWLVRWTAALVFVGVVGAGVSLFQWQALHSTDDATHKAANAAIRSAEVAEQALRMAERPIVNVGNWEFSNLGPNLAPVIKYRIGNNGKSAAIVFDQTAVLVYDGKLPQSPTYSIGPYSAIIPGGGGFTTAVLDNPPPPLINAARYALMSERKQFIFIYGRVSYRDTFDDIYDLGYVIRIEAIKATNGSIVFRDAIPSEGAGFTYLTKRPPEKK